MAEGTESMGQGPQQDGQAELAGYLSMIESVPEAGGDVWESIVANIFAAESQEDLDKPWRAESLRAYDGHALDVQRIRRMPSDFHDGWGYYLIVDAVDLETGEKVVGTTGSVGVVAQLVKAHVAGWLPLPFVVRVADRPTKAGYRPMRLQVAR